jgi:hypothetical protein
MNRCSFSEDETTLATRSLKQNNSGGNISGVTMADVWNADQSHQNLDSHVGLRKKHGLKELPNIMYKEGGPIRLSNPAKKSLQVSATNGSLNDVKPSPLVTEPLSLKLSKSSHLAVEKLEHKPREKHRGLDICSDRGMGFKVAFLCLTTSVS